MGDVAYLCFVIGALICLVAVMLPPWSDEDAEDEAAIDQESKAQP